ncbi:putative classes i and ii family protein [Diplodia seriata]|uniref:Putative classes i and ii family protein n=1 Tax=Diplodia seriata TaxID=420778 RepID=A0A0G2GZP8_9PEZI|nr:putative classes i and ii family protein [Diplodia seriata]
MRAPIDLQLGWPSTTLHPSGPLLTSASPILTAPEQSAAALNYGPGHGYGPLRASIASWLTASYAPRDADGRPYAIPPNRVMVGNGASGTLLNAVLRLAAPAYTRAVWMVEPTYFLACPIFADAGFGGDGDDEGGPSRMRGVPEDDEGIDVGFLRAAIERVEAEVRAGTGGSTRSGGNPAHFSSMFVHQMLSTGALQNHIDTVLVPTYRRRYHALMSAIKEYLVPLGVVIDVGKKYEASIASSSQLYEGSAGKLATIARDKHKCKFAFGDMFKIEGDPGSAERARRKGGFEMGIRLCWAWLEEEQLVEGVWRMAETIKD